MNLSLQRRTALAAVAICAQLACGARPPLTTIEGRPGSDAGEPDAGVPLFVELFGANDTLLPGKSCKGLGDKCRGSDKLYVCLTDDGSPVGEGATCRRCTTDAQCETEYYYYAPHGLDVGCGADGLCRPIGPDGVTREALYCEGDVPGFCLTARMGWFVCGADQKCARCSHADQCSAPYGPTWICGANSTFPIEGACAEPF